MPRPINGDHAPAAATSPPWRPNLGAGAPAQPRCLQHLLDMVRLEAEGGAYKTGGPG